VNRRTACDESDGVSVPLPVGGFDAYVSRVSLGATLVAMLVMAAAPALFAATAIEYGLIMG
jgi:hypothetical protein